jgi:hypothetical protein
MAARPPELVDRLTGYIQHNAQKTPADLHSLVQQGHDQLVALISAMTEAQASFKPAPDVWSVIELLGHVVTAKGGTARICQRLARGETPTNRGREGEEQDGVTRDRFASLADARPALEAAHQDLLAFIDGPMAAANTDARFNHFVFGDLNCREWAAFQRVHDGDHAQQIEQIMAAPGYPYPSG